jgi:hypothetical protein
MNRILPKTKFHDKPRASKLCYQQLHSSYHVYDFVRVNPFVVISGWSISSPMASSFQLKHTMQQTSNLAQNATCKVICIFPFSNILVLLLAIVIKKCYVCFGTAYFWFRPVTSPCYQRKPVRGHVCTSTCRTAGLLKVL